jgi:hypothetical protein
VQCGTSLSRIIFALIYECRRKRWDGPSDYDYGYFFANPASITEKGPKNLLGIVEAHKELVTITKAHAPKNIMSCRRLILQSL